MRCVSIKAHIGVTKIVCTSVYTLSSICLCVIATFLQGVAQTRNKEILYSEEVALKEFYNFLSFEFSKNCLVAWWDKGRQSTVDY